MQCRKSKVGSRMDRRRGNKFLSRQILVVSKKDFIKEIKSSTLQLVLSPEHEN